MESALIKLKLGYRLYTVDRNNGIKNPDENGLWDLCMIGSWLKILWGHLWHNTFFQITYIFMPTLIIWGSEKFRMYVLWLILAYQFGFWNKHLTIYQVHIIINIFEKALEERQIVSTIFLDVVQAFNKSGITGWSTNWEIYHTISACLLKSYISGRYFQIKHEDCYSKLKETTADVPQGSVLGQVLYLLYMNNIPSCEEAVTCTFADDTAIIAEGNSIEEVTEKLQSSTDKVSSWTKRWWL